MHTLSFMLTVVARPLMLLLLLPALARAETGVQAWVQTYEGPANDWDQARAVAVDRSNNVIVTGYSSGSGKDYATFKYSSAGVPLWTNRYDSSPNGQDYAVAVAVDANDDVIVTGYSEPAIALLDDADYVTIKYSSAGVPLWTNRYNGPGSLGDRPSAIAVDASNAVLVTGFSWGDGGSDDYATVKYSSAGVPLWTNRYDGPSNGEDLATAVAVDGNNDVLVTGYSAGENPVTDDADYLTIKYSSEGLPLWTNRYSGPGDSRDEARAIAVDRNNNVIVTGNSSGKTYDYATVQYSSAGAPLWTNRYNGPGNGDDYATAVAVDGHNNVIVTGYSPGIEGDYDYATLQYSSAGVPLWTNRYNGEGNVVDYSYAVAVDSSNNIIVTGQSDYTFATIKYSSAGVPLWTESFSSALSPTLALDHNGDVIVAGTFVHGHADYDNVTLKYVSVPSPALTALPFTGGTFQIRVDNVLQPGTLVLEASTDMVDWAPVFTNTTPTNTVFYTEPVAGSAPARFYRAFQGIGPQLE